MKLGKLCFLAFACCTVMFVKSANAQTDNVHLRFEIDGRQVNEAFRVLLYAGDRIIEPTKCVNGFAVPSDIRDYETVNVRIFFGEHNLFFESVHVSKFRTDWTVGIDNEPFEEENVTSEHPDPPGQRLVLIYYINFTSRSGLDTRTVIRVYR